MKRYRYFLIVFALPILVLFVPAVSAQSMMNSQSTSTDTTSNSGDAQKGQDIYDQLQNKQTTCAKLTDNDFDALGDFFMNRMMGSSIHEVMDQHMAQTLGSAGERQAHIAMGERLSGCNTNANYPSPAENYAPTAWMGMMGDNNSGWDMMGGYDNSSWSGIDVMLTALLVVAIVAALFAWLRPRARIAALPIDILKTRYAKGEITKEEFEQLKRDIR